MMRRSRAREVALQLLFWHEAKSTHDRASAQRFIRDRLRDAELELFCWRLIDGVRVHRAAIDSKLSAAAENWRLARMAVVDRNVLRVGAFELMDPTGETPAPVAINEAIELARRFGSADSPKFVNGVLDKLRSLELDIQGTPAPSTKASTSEPHTPDPEHH